MLPKHNRLPLRTRFVPEFQVQTPIAVVKVKKNNSEESRFAFVISKRVAKSAVARNSIKRALRQCVHENLKMIKPGYDMLFVAKREQKDLLRGQMCAQVCQELQRKSLLSN